MLDGWHEFYILLGTAAAALVALMFVAASIGAGYLSAERAGATRTFTSPIIFHYTYVLFLSLAALVPINTDTSLAAIIGISAAAGFVNSIFILVRVMRSAATTSPIASDMAPVRWQRTPPHSRRQCSFSSDPISALRFWPARWFFCCSSTFVTHGI
jgi:hypothetical protein